eukprot:5945187-Amphidinium_carterae.1
MHPQGHANVQLSVWYNGEPPQGPKSLAKQIGTCHSLWTRQVALLTCAAAGRASLTARRKSLKLLRRFDFLLASTFAVHCQTST